MFNTPDALMGLAADRRRRLLREATAAAARQSARQPAARRRHPRTRRIADLVPALSRG